MDWWFACCLGLVFRLLLVLLGLGRIWGSCYCCMCLVVGLLLDVVFRIVAGIGVFGVAVGLRVFGLVLLLVGVVFGIVLAVACLG